MSASPKKSHSPPTRLTGARRMVVDASGAIVGRLASHVAKRLLDGHEIVVVNAEKAIIAGRRDHIVDAFKTRLGRRTLGSQTKAPKHPRRPETYVRRVVRGMLPWKQPRGKQAYRRLKVYLGVPPELQGASVETLPDAVKDIYPSLTVGTLMSIFGWTNPLEVTHRAP